jgi:hypothetical protein
VVRSEIELIGASAKLEDKDDDRVEHILEGDEMKRTGAAVPEGREEQRED